MTSEIEIAAMRRAIAISAQGIGATAPNPPVGCVILDEDGDIVGEGYHHRKGEAHAEVNALAAAGELARGGTAVVTLEPCNHFGRTPPCRQALLGAGVSRVVVALLDPTSRGDGGVAALRAAGVSVEVGVAEHEALLVLGPWRRSLDSGAQVTWLYALSANGSPIPPPPGSAASTDAATLMRLTDLVVDEDLALSEGQPGSHEWPLPKHAFGAETTAAEFLEWVAEIGARTVTVVGRTRLASEISRSGLLARTVAYLPHTQPSEGPHSPAQSSWAPSGLRPSWAPSGLRLIDVLPLPGWVRLTSKL